MYVIKNKKAIPGNQKQHNMSESAFTVIYLCGETG